MRWSFLLSAAALALGCGGDPPPARAPKKPTPAKAARCAPGDDDMPADAKQRMASLQAEVRRCWALGTPGKAESTVKVEVTVAASGVVRGAKVFAEGQPTAKECLVKTLKGAKFSKFCGSDVSINWTYALR